MTKTANKLDKYVVNTLQWSCCGVHRDGRTVSDLSPGGEQTVARVVESVADSVVEINCTVETTTSYRSVCLQQPHRFAFYGNVAVERAYYAVGDRSAQGAQGIAYDYHRLTHFEPFRPFFLRICLKKTKTCKRCD